MAIERASALARGARLTQAHAAIGQALGVRARVLPMSDRPVRTRVMAGGRWWPFQEFMIKGGGRVRSRPWTTGAPPPGPTPEVRQAIAAPERS